MSENKEDIIQNLSKEDIKKKTMKYGNDDLYESPIDTHIFHPLGLLLVDPLRYLGLNPNQVTVLSAVSACLACYYYSNNKIKEAILCYLMSYILDCVDGRMARKYNMGSKLGAALDLTSDVFVTSILMLTIYIKKKDKLKSIHYIGFAIVILGLSLCHGLTEAIANYDKVGHDDFYKTKKEEYKDENHIIFKFYLSILKSSHKSYKTLIPQFDKHRINRYMEIVKYFGPGTSIVIILGIMYYLKDDE
jgi:phosphatidylglycerophosphate synthase